MAFRYKVKKIIKKMNGYRNGKKKNLPRWKKRKESQSKPKEGEKNTGVRLADVTGRCEES